MILILTVAIAITLAFGLVLFYKRHQFNSLLVKLEDKETVIKLLSSQNEKLQSSVTSRYPPSKLKFSTGTPVYSGATTINQDPGTGTISSTDAVCLPPAAGLGVSGTKPRRRKKKSTTNTSTQNNTNTKLTGQPAKKNFPAKIKTKNTNTNQQPERLPKTNKQLM